MSLGTLLNELVKREKVMTPTWKRENTREGRNFGEENEIIKCVWCIVLLCSQFNQMAIIYGPS
jgi:hypothetical protein